MRKSLLFTFSVIVFLLSYIYQGFAQSSADWMNDRPYSYVISGLGGYSGSSFSTKEFRSKIKKDRERRSRSSDNYDHSAELQIQAEIRRAAEQARREEEFVSKKGELQESLRGNDYSGTTGYSSGLRGLSDGGSSQVDNSSYSNGLRGLSGESTSSGGEIDYRVGLRGLSNESSSRYANKSERQIDEGLRGLFTDESHYVSSRSSDKSMRSISASNLGASSINNSTAAPKRIITFQSTREYTTYVADYNPQPVYYQGPGSALFKMGVADDSEESWVDKVEGTVDIWRETGEHEVLTYIGDKLSGFARKTVTRSSAVGAWFYKVLDFANESVGIKNLVVKTAERNLDAIKKSSATLSTRYVNEANRASQKVINSYASGTLEKKGLLPPNAKSLDKKSQNVSKDLAETGATKGIELWLSRRNKN